MNIAFFETGASDREYFSQALPEHKLFFFEEPLSETSASQAAGCEIISVFIYSAVNAAVLAKCKNLRCITTRSTGFDHIDAATCQAKGIAVLNVPYYGENTVAEHTFALILALSRNVHKSYARGLQEDFSIEGLKGFDLKDKTLGVVGTGHIGLHVIRIAKGFGMHVLAYDVRHDIFISEILHFKYAPLEQVLSESDIVTLHVPYNEHTHHLINQKNIQKMKRGSLLVNTARGGIVENAALIDALDRHILAGVGLDVLEGEELIKEEKQCLHEDCGPARAARMKQNHNLLSRDNVVYTPHIGFYSAEALKRISDTTIQNISRFASGKIENQV